MENVNGVDELSKTNHPGGNKENTDDHSNDLVKYETYRKVLSDHKKSKAKAEELEARLAEIEQKEREAEEKRLSEQGEYKKLLEMERRKRSEEEAKRVQYQKDLLDAHKLNSFKERVGGKIAHPRYFDFVDVDKIAIDPETGHIDEGTLDEVVSSFLKEHGRLIESDKKGSPGFPQNASVDTTVLDYETWLTLPLKEQKERRNEVMNHWKKNKF